MTVFGKEGLTPVHSVIYGNFQQAVKQLWAGYKGSTWLWGYGVSGVDGLLTHQMDENAWKGWVQESELNLGKLLSAYNFLPVA